MDKESDFPVDTRHKISGIDITKKVSDIECTCRQDDEFACKRILPVGTNHHTVIVYNSCKRTLYAAFKRQLKKVVPPDPQVVIQLQQFMDRYFDTYILPEIQNFDYSYSEWFNAMPRHKQEAILKVDQEKMDEVVYGLFCKREKQKYGEKNRAISNISQEVKFIMGPVVSMLEEIADKNFPGYCGKKSWNDLEDTYRKNFADGYIYVIQGDGSGFDLSQHNENKHIDFKIYDYLSKNNLIHHVENSLFKKISGMKKRKLKATYTYNGKMFTLASAIVNGTVFSGSSDTTFGNTLRMAIYNMFTLEKMGLKYEDDYRILCKGDDFMIFVKELRNYEQHYYKYWSKPIKDPNNYDYSPFGIGQILKFLKVGLYETIDFCSTIVIPDYKKGIFKIARKPDRVNPLGHYSRVALQMSKPELKQYYLDLAMALDISVPKMPLFNELSSGYKKQASYINVTPCRLSQGRQRLIIPDDGHRCIKERVSPDVLKYQVYGRDFYEGLKQRQSSLILDENLVYDFLLENYHISKEDIKQYGLMIQKENMRHIFDPLVDNVG
jgi:hypothetical protein